MDMRNDTSESITDLWNIVQSLYQWADVYKLFSTTPDGDGKVGARPYPL
jgi:hypothetical protein